MVVDPTSLKLLRVKATGFADVWDIALPGLLFFWKKGAEEERSAWLEELTSIHPNRALGVIDWSNEDQRRWFLLGPGESLEQNNYELSEGGWVYFFFDSMPPSIMDTLLALDGSSSDAEHAIDTLRKVGARAGIWSWYDDCEWLFAVDRR